jgi:hypothetical protein
MTMRSSRLETRFFSAKDRIPAEQSDWNNDVFSLLGAKTWFLAKLLSQLGKEELV